MKEDELLEKLKKSNIPKSVYSLEGGLPNEAYCLEEMNGMWVVYYSERGNKNILGQFEHKDKAYDFLYKKIMRNYT